MPVQAGTLFEVLFPQIFAQKRNLLPKVDGVVSFSVIGDDAGVWTFDLRKGGDGALRKGPVGDSDLTIVLADTFLDQFFIGDYDAEMAIKSGKISIVGDRKVFGGLVDLLMSAPPEQLPTSGASRLRKPESKGLSLRKGAGNRKAK
jgi:hypothetical protein